MLGNWYIPTLTGKELKLIEEAKRYYLDIIGVSSTKKRGSRNWDLVGGWKLFYSDADPSRSAQAGVGILIGLLLPNCVQDYGKTPRDWQTGVITPIFKIGDRKQRKNYRGISPVAYARFLKGGGARS